MSNFDEREIDVCTVCIHLLANGEFNDGTNAAEVAAAGMARMWGDDARHMSPGGTPEREAELEGGWFTRDCESCGSTDHGERHAAVVLIPTA